ncbi:MAG: hypothetical protein IJC48_02565 [Clostridia bacterium]|nr:hypothetical protein [Clostridia bacterium]
MKWNRQEFIDLLTFNHPPREMFVELMGPLVGLEDEWRRQGASEGEIALTDFGFDYVPVCTVGNMDAIHGFPETVIEETGEYVIRRDYLGRTSKLIKGYASIPLPMDFPVKCMDDWRKIKHMFEYDESRVDTDALLQAKKLQSQGVLIRASIPGGFDLPRELMGDEMACVCGYEDPELLNDILDTAGITCERVIDRITKVVSIDYLFVHEDMAGKSGPLWGPKQVLEFVKPYYRGAWDLASSRGTKIFSQDSDGNMNAVIDAFIECGINVFYPCEPAGNMDIVELRKKYGSKFAVMGGIDKHVLRKSKEDIDRELEYKLQPCMRSGGTVFGLDHRIPNGTPLNAYRYYVNQAREMLGIAEFEKGWGRMAF